jgi:hypothetical protein
LQLGGGVTHLRHSDIKLTARVYTDETQLPIYEAIKGLPRLLDHTQMRAQILGATGQNVAKAGASSEGKEHTEIPLNGGVRRNSGNGASEGIRIMAKLFLISLSIWYLMCYKTSV